MVMIVDLDRPQHDDEPAAVTALVELVTEFQAPIETCGDLVAGLTDARHLPRLLPAIDTAVATASHRYWQQLRAYTPTAELRSATRRDNHWRTWTDSVEVSQLRCEESLTALEATVRASWREVADLLMLCLPTQPPPATSASAAEVTAQDQPDSVADHLRRTR
ncbi:hypothetical protein [Rhodococcus kronopolitis]|uniref:Uncharacterized protein n=1 Tax=Rhodococcus kronopolitis TaxID=1460226 RepID=A0ABV9FT26_9NOCA